MAEVTPTVVSAAAPAQVRDFVDLDVPALVPGPSRLEEIERRNRAGNVWTLVLDDDPTGTQTVSGVPVLTAEWSEKNLDWASRDPSGMTFALTNSRSLSPVAAEQLTTEIITKAAHVAQQRNLRLRVISRSDSTLRGHFAIEVAAAHAALRAAGCESRGTIFVPAFLEAGRVTAHDVQWVQTPTGYVPAAHTEFAEDSTFGYTEEDLTDWVLARSEPAASAPVTISLEDLRQPSAPNTTCRWLQALDQDQTVIANATRSEDLEQLMLGLLDAEEDGQSLVIRSGPSFVRLCAAQPPSTGHATTRITEPPAAPREARHGLVVVGSHTALTNSQVDHALEHHPLRLVDLDVSHILKDAHTRDAELRRCTTEVTASVQRGDVMLRTSRDLITDGRTTALEVSAAVAEAVVEVVRDVSATSRLRFLVAKGGITSSDLAVRALAARRATVVGQMLPGLIPLWELLDGFAPDLPYVVFPGNVGTTDTLTHVLSEVSR